MSQLKNTVSAISYVRKVICRTRLLAFVVLSIASTYSAQAFSGATVPWTTYEAENMTISGGTILGPQYGPNVVASEASGRECVQLNGTGQYVQLTAQAAANAIVVRYSVPDTGNGGGTNYTISLYTNGIFAQKLPVTSQYSWLYGPYPFTNNPDGGNPRNFFDEVRLSRLTINAGDTVRIEKDTNDAAAYCVIDLVDLEDAAAAPLTGPTNSYSITSYGAVSGGVVDCTVALQNCINAAVA
ncbi:MAG TPA: coagulation factor 5/8 type domain-containing protein, partial [Phycisphaerae bacterium]|nr:coagulation factor 5/8 type domain-containing protein [Phycisphaerae bacterium]